MRYCKAGQKHTPSQGLPYITASSVPVALCTVGRRINDDDNNNKMSLGAAEEVKCLVNIWEDERISQLLDATN